MSKEKKPTGKLVRYFDTRRRLDKRDAIFHFIVSRARPSYVITRVHPLHGRCGDNYVPSFCKIYNTHGERV